MELVIQILMLFIVVNVILKLSFWKWWQAAFFTVACSIFVIVSCQWAILQSQTQLADYLSNQEVMQNMAVIITLESLFYVAFSFNAMKTIQTRKRKKRYANVLHWYPGLLLFPVLFYLLTQAIYAFPGTDFTSISNIFAVAVFVGIPAASYIIKYVCPETELRLEVHFGVSLFVCIIGLITTVNGQVTYTAMEESTDWRAIIFASILFLSTFFIGLFWDKIKWIIKSKIN